MYPNRRNSLRCKGFDYRSSVGYFVTTCAHEQRHFFGKQNPTLQITLSPAGQIVEQCLKEIPSHFPYAEIDIYSVMPNHVHFVVILRQMNIRDPLPQCIKNDGAGTLSRLVGSFKSACSLKIRRQGLISGSIWQRNFYDRILMDEAALNAVRQYIADNPVAWALEWKTDRFSH